jgi:hypothetical protein
MPHLGRRYPVFNPARIINTFWNWPLLPGTEYQWLCDGWLGLAASTTPTSGRGLLPTVYAPGSTTINWESVLATYLGLPLTLVQSVALNGSGNATAWSLSLFYDLSLCFSWLENGNGPDAAEFLDWPAGSLYSPGPSAAILHPFHAMTSGVVPWTASPKPPIPLGLGLA